MEEGIFRKKVGIIFALDINHSGLGILMNSYKKKSVKSQLMWPLTGGRENNLFSIETSKKTCQKIIQSGLESYQEIDNKTTKDVTTQTMDTKEEFIDEITISPNAELEILVSPVSSKICRLQVKPTGILIIRDIYNNLVWEFAKRPHHWFRFL